MTRIARVIAVDYPHHITQRGNNRQNVFNDDKDRRKYLSLIKQYTQKYEVSVLSYCLMPNHVHFISIPRKEDSLAKTFNFAHMRYAQYFNKKTSSCGHLWQGRFYSCVLDQLHLIAAAQYIERNPVRAKMVKRAWEWKWSSAAYNIGNKPKDVIIDKPLVEYIGLKKQDWKDSLIRKDNEVFVRQIKSQTARGLPLAQHKSISILEEKLKRKLRAEPRGRRWKR